MLHSKLKHYLLPSGYYSNHHIIMATKSACLTPASCIQLPEFRFVYEVVQAYSHFAIVIR